MGLIVSNPPEPEFHPPPKAMTIAGSDSGGGAGIQADLKTFAALGVYGTSVLTAVTAQNTRAVLAIAEVPEEVIELQIDGVMEDIGADAVKTGMLSSASIIEVVANRLEAWGVDNLVVDPVMVAKSGDHLLQPTAISALRRKLLPLALVVTPNLAETEVLAMQRVATREEAENAARKIADTGARYVVIKGGHRDGPPIDLIYDGASFHELHAERIDTQNTHGTGCTFSAAIAAHLALGVEPLDAIAAAKRYITEALKASYPIGDGHSPVNHFYGVRPVTALDPALEGR
ncbi:MAG TPA: bifunctional hydroxymethylpyrimidine kinase/phosphomethylpyrimidine kinase [Thermomicrobiales bacterium]|nr:bifunctional hydroxymethylpyrimidine kinase/phosphomethylpyrimidine kinase [Thermomicrobiales bacterium]